ncbi:MAG: NADP-dependent isocitrate dehydrogenase, partial [Deltaproteobacteria bacterium]
MKEKEYRAENITWDERGLPGVPYHPVVGYIEGDGIGPDIWHAARAVLDAAVS